MMSEVKTKLSLEPGSRPLYSARSLMNRAGQSHLGWLEHMIINAFNDTWNEWPDANLFIWGKEKFIFFCHRVDIQF